MYIFQTPHPTVSYSDGLCHKSMSPETEIHTCWSWGGYHQAIIYTAPNELKSDIMEAIVTVYHNVLLCTSTWLLNRYHQNSYQTHIDVHSILFHLFNLCMWWSNGVNLTSHMHRVIQGVLWTYLDITKRTALICTCVQMQRFSHYVYITIIRCILVRGNGYVKHFHNQKSNLGCLLAISKLIGGDWSYNWLVFKDQLFTTKDFRRHNTFLQPSV